MLRLAVAGEPGFTVDTRELERSGPSYTVDTLRAVRAERPGDELFLIVGADAAGTLEQWREAAALADLATIVIIPRPGHPAPGAGPGTIVADVALTDESATAARATAARGEPLERLVPPAVAEYIAAKGLYRTGV